MFDFDFDIDWKSVAIGAGAVAAVAGAVYGISKLCEDDDEGSSRGGESSLPKQKSPVEILLDVTAMNKVVNSCMPFETIQAVADKFNFKLPDHIGRTTGIMIIFNSNNDEMIKAVVEEFNKWEASELNNDDDVKSELVELMDEIIKSNMPASLIKAAAQKVNIVFTSEYCRKEMIKTLFLNGEDGVAAIKSQYEKWKNKEFASEKKEDNSKTSEPQTEETKEEESK